MNVLFEDADIIVIDKPAGRIVHPAPGHEDGSITGELVKRCPEMAGVGSAERPGVVHRLVRFELPAKIEIGGLGFREDHHAARVPVEAVNDARTLHGADAGHFRTMFQQLIRERPAFMPWRRMDDLSRRLVNDDQFAVLIKQSHRLLVHGFHGFTRIRINAIRAICVIRG